MVVIKVKIGIRAESKRREADHPDFNVIREQVADWPPRLDWSMYIDRHGGWHYDNICGHQEEDETSPRGMQWGMLCVPEDFALAALDAFPDLITVLDDAEAGQFYEERVTVEQPEIHDDLEILQAIAARKQLGLDEPQDANALNPDHPQRGRRRNNTKTWTGYKQHRGIQLDADAIGRLKGRGANG